MKAVQSMSPGRHSGSMWAGFQKGAGLVGKACF